jgi:YVTN family beta-propeller protein
MKKITFVSRCFRAPIIAAGMLAAVVLPASQMSAATVVIPTPGVNPEGLVVGPIGTQNLYMAGITSTNVSVFTVINTQFNTITAQILLRNLNVLGHPVEHGATTIAENPAGTLVFIVNSSSFTVSVVSTVTNTQIATFSAPVIGPIPAGTRVSPNGKQLWTACLATGPFFNNGTVNITSIEPGATFGTPVGLVNTGSSPNEVVFNSKGSVAFVQNGSVPGNTGFIDEVNARIFPYKILRNNIGALHLNNPNPVSMDITRDNSTLYVGSFASDIVNLDIPTGGFDNNIFMFPLIPPAGQQIGQVLVNPNQRSVVAAGTTLGSVTVASTATQQWTSFVLLPAGAVPYFMAYAPRGRTLYVSNFNGAIFPVGGLQSISAISPAP